MKRRWKRREQRRRREDELDTLVNELEQVTEFGEGQFNYVRMRRDGGNRIEIHRFKTQQAATTAMKYGQLYDHVKRASTADDPWSGGHPVRMVVGPESSEPLN